MLTLAALTHPMRKRPAAPTQLPTAKRNLSSDELALQETIVMQAMSCKDVDKRVEIEAALRAAGLLSISVSRAYDIAAKVRQRQEHRKARIFKLHMGREHVIVGITLLLPPGAG